jgi:hypothetical protein
VEFYSSIKNEIALFARKMDGTGDFMLYEIN